MLSVLADRTYRHLFLAQVVALLGTGLATIALGLLAYDLSGERAGLVLGTNFTIKMVAYVGIAPIAGAFANRWPRRTMLVSPDLIRAAAAPCLPFVSEVWQVYVLIFVLQSTSAAIPLTFVGYNSLFLGTVAGFVGSAVLVVSVPKPTAKRGIYDRTTRKTRIYLATPRLRGLLSSNFAAAAAVAMVLMNTVVLVRSDLGLGALQVAITLGAFGGGSMLAALLLPRQLDNRPDRSVMIGGALFLVAALLALSLTTLVCERQWRTLLVGWFIIGIGYSNVLTPS